MSYRVEVRLHAEVHDAEDPGELVPYASPHFTTAQEAGEHKYRLEVFLRSLQESHRMGLPRLTSLPPGATLCFIVVDAWSSDVQLEAVV
jgi:hypothetical protein